MADEEPVGYLGGDVQEDDPYADPYANSDDDPYGEAPAGGDDEEEVAGYLGGDAEPEEVEGYLGGATDDAPPEEDLPALPGGTGDGYTASDFIDSGEAEPHDPYADPYADAEDPYADPYAMPDDGYDEPAPEDDGYFESMGHEPVDDYEDDYESATQVDDYPTETVDDYADDDSPKTISQQDAESIIRRITTKRILPPESEGKAVATPQRLTASGGGLRIWPIALVLLLLAAGGVFAFREQIAQQYPELAPYLGVTLKEENVVEVVEQRDPDLERKDMMLQTILKSEMKAFSVTATEDVRAVSAAAPGKPGANKPKPPATDPAGGGQ